MLDWAYEEFAGEPIHIGSTSGGAVGPVPEPSTYLAGLAMGAAGILAYRQRRKSAAAVAE